MGQVLRPRRMGAAANRVADGLDQTNPSSPPLCAVVPTPLSPDASLPIASLAFTRDGWVRDLGRVPRRSQASRFYVVYRRVKTLATLR